MEGLPGYEVRSVGTQPEARDLIDELHAKLAPFIDFGESV